jgi:hypothetical protein
VDAVQLFSGDAVDQRPLDLDGERTTSTTLGNFASMPSQAS